MYDKIEEVDILAIGVHPDDIELSCGATLLKQQKEYGHSIGLLDLTAGELGTRGSGELRLNEAADAARILGARFRANVGLRDGFFQHTSDEAEKLIPYIRAAKPKLVLTNTVHDRHPDHGRASRLTVDACFLAGLRRIETVDPISGEKQEVHRPEAVYSYVQDYSLEPDIVVDVNGYMDKKMEAVLAYKSQFYDPESDEPQTPISGKDFMDFIRAKAHTYGRWIGVDYGEGFKVHRPIGVRDLLQLH